MNNIRGHFCIVVGLSQRKGQAWPSQLNCAWIQRQPEICSSLIWINNLFCRQPLWSHQSWSWSKAWPAVRGGGTWCLISRSAVREVRLRHGLLTCPKFLCPFTKVALPLWAPAQGWGCWIKGRCETEMWGATGRWYSFDIFTSFVLSLSAFDAFTASVDKGTWLSYTLCFHGKKK